MLIKTKKFVRNDSRRYPISYTDDKFGLSYHWQNQF